MSTGTDTRRGRKNEPQRTCVACRRKADQRLLVRLVRSPEGEVLVDHPHRLGGRGAYVCSSMSCVTRAAKGRHLSQLVGGPVAPLDPAALKALITDRIERRVVGLLAAASRSRKAAIGADAAAQSLRAGCRLVVVATDASPRVRRDIDDLALRSGTAVLEFGDRSQLGSAFGRSVVAAVAVTDDGLAEAVRHELEMLRGLTLAQQRKSEPSQRDRTALERAT